VQVFLEPDEPRVLPVPYWTDGEPDRRFWNVKRDPALIAKVPELSDCAELRSFVARVNAASRFATLGCAHWIAPSRHPGFTHEAGLYVDLVADRFERAASRRAALELVDRLRARCEKVEDGPAPTIIRVQPQRVAFTALGGKTAWMLSTWVFGAGTSAGESVSARRTGLDEVAALCDVMSAEIEAREGVRGTPIP
jgi:hypothetical protein